MIRLLLACTIAFVTYRLARKLIEDVPDTVDPLLLPVPKNDREALRRQSAAMGVDPER
ncbi:hypothetical protein LB566_02005 [Mesorhizobium sp. CA13]|jgi:hypothetical protein|uniref:hypothetical protein n=1 Tax=unclassified Mesorhizobium TaxID=325217 RepID=UPI0015E38F0F|nr:MULTISPECIES: hypothetical protein [unclassified Mesorhizobium]MBZ9808569.1 hypothetical protein [Mesorhizobium sp. ESP-6-2]MBZ9852554.1 hypothetical protein [Mesorhizobium sp. CA13]MBZ9874217.1 hypothetical protein [Mesorhizobium sp. BR1-1-9]MBZ9919036.1 hypothetical protein [Mesorhizobium sp. BR1-1-7]MBZ9941456.1 hypothetical protein [Mesorhizobium sp. BR1-1-13]